MRHWTLLLIASVILVSGCTSISSRGEGVVVSLQADPPTVFANSSTILHIDVDNRQEKSVYNIIAQLFDKGLLLGEGCADSFPRLLPREFQSFSCRLYTPEKIEEPYTETEVNVRTTFDSELSAVQVFEVISEDEHERRAAFGYSSSPRTYAYNDKNVRFEVEFSEQPPLVMRPGKEYFVYLTITNVGNGFISSISPGDLTILPNNPRSARMLRCPILEQNAVLYPNGNTFPRIACEVISTPVAASESADFVVTLKYNYETRNRLRINVVR